MPVIGGILCQDIKTSHVQQIVNAAPTAGEGARVQGMISALVTAAIAAGFLVNSRLKDVHWQPGPERPPLACTTRLSRGVERTPPRSP